MHFFSFRISNKQNQMEQKKVLSFELQFWLELNYIYRRRKIKGNSSTMVRENEINVYS